MLEVSYLSTNTEQRVTISYIEVTLNIVWSITSITELLLNYNYVSFIQSLKMKTFWSTFLEMVLKWKYLLTKGKADMTALVRLLLISNPNVMIELGKGSDRGRDNR